MNNISLPQKRFFPAFLVGWILYLHLAMYIIAENGILGWIFQLPIGAIDSLIKVLAAFLLGLLLRIPILKRLWYSSSYVPIVILAASIIVSFYGEDLGLTAVITHTKNDDTFVGLNPLAGYIAQFCAVFATLHFSRPSKDTPALP